MSAEKKQAPARIYLQDDGDFEAARGPDLTWCEDRINDRDTEYVRGDLADALRARYEEAMEALAEIVPLVPVRSQTDPRRHWPSVQEVVSRVKQARALIDRHREGGDG